MTTIVVVASISIERGRTPDFSGQCELVRIVDGDTVDVHCGQDEARVRLLRIDTPERGEPGYREASESLRALIDGATVTLAFEKPGKPKADRYGRILAYLIDENGRNVNVELVRGGLSAFYTRFGGGRLAESFKAAQQEAQAASRGIWRERAAELDSPR